MRELEGKTGFCEVLLGGGKSSSKVTHCLGGWCRGATAGGRDEGATMGKVGGGDGLRARGSKEAGAGLRLDDGPNGDMVLWSWVVGTAVGAPV